MPESTRPPDALMIPAAWPTPFTADSRHHAIQDLAGPILRTDPLGGRDLVIRVQPKGDAFVTCDPDATLLFPTRHPKAYQGRYRWEAGEGGIEHGHLIED